MCTNNPVYLTPIKKIGKYTNHIKLLPIPLFGTSHLLLLIKKQSKSEQGSIRLSPIPESSPLLPLTGI
uniref:Putative ovule protein n=1 Tax=Solanum chacoense TaxID=4108 RepID=A0A0V0HT44_SOLCH